MSTNTTEVVPAVKPTKKPGVAHVIGNMKYPDYIRNHPVFHKQDDIQKVFPHFGLPNTVEECEYSCINDARSDATNLMYTDVRNALATALSYAVPAAHQQVGQLVRDVYTLVTNYYNSFIAVEEGRIAVKFHVDCGTLDGKVAFRKGEGFFKAYNKLAEKYKEATNRELTALESMPYFKNFSSTNVPVGKKFKLVFSSAGEGGLWDIATISMRGISSCQTWLTPQSHGLIGSMSSKYVGVIYITSGEKFNDYGSKMLRRSLVRFCINSKTKKAGLLIDRVYPAHDQATIDLFRKFLKEKTGLPVIFSGEAGWNEYQFPRDVKSWKLTTFKPTELTYMDTKIPLVPEKGVTVVKDTAPYYSAIMNLDSNVSRKLHAKILKMLDEYCLDKKTHREVFKGGVGNLLLSLKKHLGGTIFASELFTPVLYNQIVAGVSVPHPKDFATIRDFEKGVIRYAFMQMRSLEKQSDAKIKGFPAITKSYTKSLPKYKAFFMSEYKKELIEVYKNIVSSKQ